MPIEGAIPHPIRILWSSKGGFEVFPPVLHTTPGDECVVRNLTNYPAQVTIPPEIVAGGTSSSVGPNGGEWVFTVDGRVPGIYEYFVDVSVNNLSFRGRGGSDPRIIID